jgi:putative ABC transport system permease protein
MLKYYLVSYLRNLKKYKLFTIANIISITGGVSISLITFLFVLFHLSFDNFHKDAKNIYRICRYSSGANTNTSILMPIDLTERIGIEFPEITECASIASNRHANLSLDGSEENIRSIECIPTESGFLNIFSVEFISGYAKEFLKSEESAVITESLAKELFPGQNPLGKMVYINIAGLSKNKANKLQIKGEIKDFPINSQFAQKQLIVSSKLIYNDLSTYNRQSNSYDGSLVPINKSEVYIKLLNTSNKNNLEEKLNAYINKNTFSFSEMNNVYYKLQNLKDIHLGSEKFAGDNYNDTESPKSIFAFLTIGCVFLLGAFINYFGYSLIYFKNRIKEAGINKILGAGNKNIAIIFVIDALFTFTITGILSIVLLQVFSNGLIMQMKSIFNNLYFLPFSGYMRFAVSPIENPGKTILFYLIIFFIMLIPALFITAAASKIKIAGMINNSITKHNEGKYLWKVLIIIQIAMPVFLIGCSLIVRNQIEFMKNFYPGYSNDNVVQFVCAPGSNYIKPNSEALLRNGAFVMKNELNKLSGIECVTMANWAPGLLDDFSRMSLTNIDGQNYIFAEVNADTNFFKTYDVQFLKKTDFSKLSLAGFKYIVVTEKIAKVWGIDYANVNLPFQIGGFLLAGVVKDIHSGSFKENDVCVLFNLCADEVNDGFTMAVKLKPGREREVKKYIAAAWSSINGAGKVFFEDELKGKYSKYEKEENILEIIKIFAIITLIMAAFSIFNTAAYSAERRKKEIAIRKISGAPVYSLLWLVIKEIITTVIAALVIACPFIVFAMQKWLMDYVHKISIGFLHLLLTGTIIMIISIATIIYIMIKAVLANPIESIRCE